MLLIGCTAIAPGMTFESGRRFTDIDLTSVAFANGMLYFGGSNEHVFVSADNGSSWRGQQLKRVDGSIAAILWTSDGAALAAINSWDVHYISVSKDHGLTWSRQWTDGDILVKTFFELQQGGVVAIGDEEQYVRSITGSGYEDWVEPDRPWKNVGDPFADIDIKDSHRFANGDVLLVGECAFSACYDPSFTKQRFMCTRLNETIDYTRMDFMNETEGCVGSDDGFIFRTVERGRTWSTVHSCGAHIRDIALDRSGAGVATGYRGLILVTTDGGRSWVRMHSGTQEYITCVVCVGDGRFVAGGDNGLWMWIRF